MADGALTKETVAAAPTSSPQPFFSVCIPTHNQAHSLAAPIRSALKQDYLDFELLVCDNASTDDTREVVQQFDDRRIRAIYWPELVSMYANHNRCVDNARGEWITFLHSDDLFPAGYLSRLFAEVQQSAGTEIVCNRHYPEEHALALELGTNDPLAVIAFTVAVNGHSPSGSANRSDAFSRYGKFLATAPIADGVLLVDWAG